MCETLSVFFGVVLVWSKEVSELGEDGLQLGLGYGDIALKLSLGITGLVDFLDTFLVAFLKPIMLLFEDFDTFCLA